MSHNEATARKGVSTHAGAYLLGRVTEYLFLDSRSLVALRVLPANRRTPPTNRGVS